MVENYSLFSECCQTKAFNIAECYCSEVISDGDVSFMSFKKRRKNDLCQQRKRTSKLVL